MTSANKRSRTRPRAAEAGSIHSNAFNFLSAVNTGVDPRTGMYSCSISLPGVAANNLCGPTVGLGLSFNALNAVNAGFGIGWALAMTRYDSFRKRLFLSSGESFLVDTFVNNTATFKDRKLRSFDLIKVGFDGEYRVVHKSGQSEILRVDAGSEGVAVLRELHSPEGYVVVLDQAAANGVAKLRKVTDGTGRRLLVVAYNVGSTVVTLHPDTEKVAFTFRLSNDRLVDVGLPEGYGDGWHFGYEETNTGLLLLNHTTVPMGGKEDVAYRPNGHTLPGKGNQPLTYMPFVVTCRRDPGRGQPVVVSRYAYSTRNFFGHGALEDWMDEEDNLYRVVMPPGQRYEYTSTETLYDATQNPVRTVERIFNRFHLLTLERTTQDGCVKELETGYDEVPELPFSRQKSTCQLPIKVTTRYYPEEKPGRRARKEDIREDIETSSFDDHGNCLTHVDVRGTREICTYYPAEGVKGHCPPDPLGFVRSLRDKRILPPVGDFPARETTYRHDLLPSRDLVGPGHVVPRSAAWYEVACIGKPTLLRDETYAFVADAGIHHGRPQGTLRVVGGVRSTTAVTYAMREVERNTPAVSLPVLVTTTTRIGSDGSNNDTTATATFRSLFDGRQVAEEDAQHVKRSIAYDGLGRLIRETASADSAFAVSETRAYTLAYEGSWMEATDATGQRTRVEQDGFGREVSHVAVNWKGDGLNHEIWRASFDVLGRMVSDIHTDVDVPVVGSTSSVLVLQTQYRYDGWDNCIATIHPSGVQSVALVDPVRRVTDEYDEVIDGGMVRQSGHIRTTTSISNKPLLVERIDSQGAQADTKYEYDSLDRCIAETNAAGHLTRHVYDACDRLSQTTLPDSTIVLRTYARHSDEAWLESIVVHHTSLPGKGVVLGKQTFDGLGRRTLLRAGQRETRYAYEEGATLPFETTLPSGEVVASRYEKYLGERLVELTTSSQPDRDKVAFEHDKKRGWLLRATNALGSQSMDYLSSGRLAKATFSYDDQVQVAIYSGYTLKGQLTRFAGVDGVERRLQFNSLGRLQRLENGALVTELEYDAFGRRSRVSTWTIDESRATVMTMEYDEHGRESRRVVTCESAHMALGQAMTHTYSATGHLEGRTCVTETGAREERYDYDVRGRLIEYRCKGLNGPVDASGRAISYQRFTLDALDNIRKLVTRFIDPLEPEKVSTFHYARQDPTQLVKLVEKQVGRPDLMLAFAYDPSGNLLRDEDGRQLEYDAIGRLIGWSAGPSQRTYRYDPLDRIGCVEDDGHRRYRYYDGDNVTYETGEASSSSYHCVEGSMLAHTKAGGVVLLGRDAQGSVIGEASAEPRQAAYTAYGHRAEGSGDSDIGFAGELMDHTTGWYLLGSYRAYNPRLMRFHSPDAASPFGAGDFNAYAYCGCNPTERVDPTGQEWWEALGLIAFGLIAFGLTVTAPGVGLSVALTLGINTEAAVAATAAGTIAAASDVYTTASVAASTVALAFDITSVAAEETGWEEGAQGFALAGMAIGAFSAGWARKAGLLKARETVGQVAGTALGAVGRGASAIGRGAGTLIRKARAADRAAAGINRSIASTAGPRLRPRPSPSAGSPDSVAQAGRSTENAVTEMAPPPLQRLARNRNGLRRRPTDMSAGNASSQPSPLTRHQGGVPDSPMTAGRQSLTASPTGDVERILSRFMETAV